MKKLTDLVLMVVLLLSTGCSTTTHKLNTDVTVLAYKSDVRGAYIIKKDNSYMILSEPSPDVAKEFSGSLSAAADMIKDIQDAKLKIDYGNKVVDLARRSQTLQILRESLFRLSEMIANRTIDTQQAQALYDRALRAVEMIALVELGNSALPDKSKEDIIQDFYKNIQPGNLTQTTEERMKEKKK